MLKHIGLVTLAIGLLACSALLFGDSTLWSQEEPAKPHSKVGLDLQILSFETKGELHTYMKTISKSLGVECKFCHDLTAFEQNVETLHKGISRKMMQMSNEINAKYFAENEHKLTCFVCHQGRKKPVFTMEELQALKIEKEQ